MVKKYSKQRDNEEKLELVVLLRNGAIYNNILNLISNANVIDIAIESRTFSMQGRVLKSFNDYQTHKWFYVMIKDYDEKVRVFVLNFD
jgi:hypothetical protein